MKKERGAPLPDEFLWDSPWIRVNRFRNRPWSFLGRIALGAVLGLLLGRVIGSLQGLLGQWIFEGIDARTSGGLDASLGRLFYVFARVLGTVFHPVLNNSPLARSYQDAVVDQSGSVSLLFLAQVHGTLNGLYQGVRPALGHRLSKIIERVILSWGWIWGLIISPLRRLIQRPPDQGELKRLLAAPTDPAAMRSLHRLYNAGRLPEPRSGLQEERETVKAFPGATPIDQKEELWWTKPSFRSDVYRWIEQEHRTEALPLLMRGLHDPDLGARRRAVHAVASLGVPEVLSPLLALLDDDDDEIRRAAATGIRSLSGVGPEPA